MMNANQNLLILTDHFRHNESNSFYTLAEAFAEHEQIEKVHICSRGLHENEGFFKGESDSFFVKNYMPGWDYHHMKDSWEDELFQAVLSEYDIVFLRIPRPVSTKLFTYLENNFNHKNIINRPSGIKTTGSKEFLLQVSDLCAPMSLVKTPEEALALSREMDLVLKPLEEYGGKGLLKIKGDQLWSGNEKVDIQKLKEFFDNENGMLAMKFLHRVTKGDKRIVVADGKIMLSTIRYPSGDSWLCNIAQGGSSEMSAPSPNEKKIAEILSPILKEYGVILYGFDTLANDKGKRILSEINTLSIGGIGPAEKESGRRIAPLIAKRIMNHLNQINQ